VPVADSCWISADRSEGDHDGVEGREPGRQPGGVGSGHHIGHVPGGRLDLLIGLTANITAMVVLVVTSSLENGPNSYPLLLAATGFLGAGFGLTVPVLNTYAPAFHPDGADRAVLVLNALLGLGTALAPVFVAVFVGLGFWWGLPILSTLLLVLLLLASVRLPLRVEATPTTARPTGIHKIPPRFWLFAAFAVLYGICETMNGNWSQQEVISQGASATQAALFLTAFWGMVTVGRLLFAQIVRRLPARIVFRVLSDRLRDRGLRRRPSRRPRHEPVDPVRLRPQPPWPCCPSPSWRVTVPRHGCIPARRRPTAQRLPPASTGTSGLGRIHPRRVVRRPRAPGYPGSPRKWPGRRGDEMPKG